jgi:hypothetical protein
MGTREARENSEVVRFISIWLISAYPGLSPLTQHYSFYRALFLESAEQAQIIEFLLSDYPSGLCAVKFSHNKSAV